MENPSQQVQNGTSIYKCNTLFESAELTPVKGEILVLHFLSVNSNPITHVSQVFQKAQYMAWGQT